MNEYSPRKSNTKWMAFLHSFAVIGVIVGYIFGSFTVKYSNLSWRFAFMVQGWFMIIIGVGFLLVDNSSIDIFLAIKKGYRPKSLSDVH